MSHVRICQLMLCLSILAYTTGLKAAGTPSDSAKELNAVGYQLYKEKNYAAALQKFEQAVQADPRHALAHYNLASTMAVLYRAGQACDYDITKPRILAVLQQAIEFDPQLERRMRQDSTLQPVHDTIAYQKLLGLNPLSPKDATLLLRRISWYGTESGAFGPVAGLHFKRDNIINYWYIDFVDGKPVRKNIQGKYKQNGRSFHIELEEPYRGELRFEGRMLPDGKLDVDGLPGPFHDDPQDCSA